MTSPRVEKDRRGRGSLRPLLFATALAIACEDEPAPGPTASGEVTVAAPNSTSASAAIEVTSTVPSPSAPNARAAPTCPRGRVLVPAGDVDESPIAAFCIDITEVTAEAYATCAKNGACEAPLRGGQCTYDRRGAERKPVNCIEWRKADAYCRQSGGLLPTERQWQHAAGGADGRTYPWGNEPPEKRACWDGEGNDLGRGNRHDPCDVGSYPADKSPFGVLDMGGNVAEWTRADPEPERGDPNQIHARRGAGWGTKLSPFPLRVTNRAVGGWDPYKVGLFVGFRCVSSPL